MQRSTAASNPFVLMIDPQTVFTAIERSERLGRLQSTICRPLDKPRPEKPAEGLKAFDAEIESIEIVDSTFGE